MPAHGDAALRVATGPRAAPTTPSWQRKLFDAGYAGINWPKQYGGRDASLTEQLVYYEEIARARAPYVGVNFVGLLHGGPTIMAEGTPEQKERHIGPIIRGEQIWCQGFSEPAAGSDLASLKTRAERDGDHYVVNGHKIWTSFAQVADYCELLVRTRSERAEAPRHHLARDADDAAGHRDPPAADAAGLGRVLARCSSRTCACRSSAASAPENDGWRVTNVTLSFERGTAFASDMVELQQSVRDLADARAAGDARRRLGLGRPRAAPRDRPPGRRARRALGDGEVHGLRGRQDGRAGR